MSERGQRQLTANWPRHTRKIILRNIPNAESCAIMSQSKDGKYSTSRLEPFVKLIISYNYEEEIFVVWNGYLHQQIHNTNGGVSMTMGSSAKSLLQNKETNIFIERCYKEIKQHGRKNCVEMVVLVGKDYLLEFCRNYEDYMIPDACTIPNGKTCLFALSDSEIEKMSPEECNKGTFVREKESVKRAKRDARFRQNVLEHWNHQCIICGIKEENVLEAAHKESVKAGGTDDAQNGYCLCANHHKMYDSGLLDIDEVENTFTYNGETYKIKPCYAYEAGGKYNLFSE